MKNYIKTVARVAIFFLCMLISPTATICALVGLGALGILTSWDKVVEECNKIPTTDFLFSYLGSAVCIAMSATMAPLWALILHVVWVIAVNLGYYLDPKYDR